MKCNDGKRSRADRREVGDLLLDVAGPDLRREFVRNNGLVAPVGFFDVVRPTIEDEGSEYRRPRVEIDCENPPSLHARTMRPARACFNVGVGCGLKGSVPQRLRRLEMWRLLAPSA